MHRSRLSKLLPVAALALLCVGCVVSDELTPGLGHWGSAEAEVTPVEPVSQATPAEPCTR